MLSCKAAQGNKRVVWLKKSWRKYASNEKDCALTTEMYKSSLKSIFN